MVLPKQQGELVYMLLVAMYQMDSCMFDICTTPRGREVTSGRAWRTLARPGQRAFGIKSNDADPPDLKVWAMPSFSWASAEGSGPNQAPHR
jgi:hypothetical protein